MTQRILLRPEQLLVLELDGGAFRLSGQRYAHIPWHLLANCWVYASSPETLIAALSEAVHRGYLIIDGASSERRGLQGFVVGLGAWGCRGKVKVALSETWGLEGDANLQQQSLRDLCTRLNAEQTPFRGDPVKWVGALYRRLCQPLEPEEHPAVLPLEVSLMGRAAHIGGPVVHARTTLQPYVQLDRVRAYGMAMLEPVPVGWPVGLKLDLKNSLARWRPHDLMRARGLAEATIEVFDTSLVPLLPIATHSESVMRTRIVYPVGTFRGVWCIAELAALEEDGRGRVLQLHRVFQFEVRPILAPLVRYLRRLEGSVPVAIKRLEHVLYGMQSRSLSMTRLRSARRFKEALLRDLLEDRALKRLARRPTVHRYPLQLETEVPLLAVRAQLSPKVGFGTLDRPERSAFIVAHNRIAMARIISTLEERLDHDGRHGWSVGRIYVDGIDMQATPDQLGELPEGLRLEGHGDRSHLYRAGTYARYRGDEIELQSAGLSVEDSVERLEEALLLTPDMEGGPFAAGRVWPAIAGQTDPRMERNQQSYPPMFRDDVGAHLGF